MRLARFALPVLLLSSIAVAGAAHAATFTAQSFVINAAQEVPTNGSAGTGTGTITVNTTTKVLHFDITYSGLTSTETAAHIHGPAPAGTNASVLFGLPATPGHKVGDWSYTSNQESSILKNLMYVNIHTTNNPGGEIRGQINFVNTNNVPGLDSKGMGILFALLAIGGMAVVWRRRKAGEALTG